MNYAMNYLMLAVVLAGLIIFSLTWRSWKKIAGSVHNQQRAVSASRSQTSVITYVAAIFTEWLGYVRGENNEKLLRSLIISVVFFAGVLWANQHYTHFNVTLLLLVALPALLLFQFRRGRAVKYALFQASFPEIIAIVGSAVSAGATIQNAIARCGEELDSPLGHEFNRISRRLVLGETPKAVFADAWERFRYPEFYSFIMVALLSMERGGQLTELVKRLGRIVAANKLMVRRKAALTSESRMTVKIIGALPFILILLLKWLKPDDFHFFVNDSNGILVLYYVFTSHFIGFLIVWLIIRRAT